jgi:hypothetical protein
MRQSARFSHGWTTSWASRPGEGAGKCSAFAIAGEFSANPKLAGCVPIGVPGGVSQALDLPRSASVGGPAKRGVFPRKPPYIQLFL